jgi:hypothetical protein
MIVALGVGLRWQVATHTYKSNKSSFSTLSKISLKYRYARYDIVDEFDKWLDGTELRDQLYTLDEERIQLGGVYEDMSGFNHPPLYYYIMHLVQVQTNYPPSINPGLKVNALLAGLTIVVVFWLGWLAFGEQRKALVSAAFYATSHFAFTSTIILKTYEFQILFVALLLALVVYQQKKDQLKIIDGLLFFLVTVILFQLHYFSYLFVLGICVLIATHELSNRPKRVVFYGLLSTGAAITSWALYPEFINKEIIGRMPIWFWGVALLVGGLVLYLAIKLLRRISNWVHSHTNLKGKLPVVYISAFGILLFALILLVSPRYALRYMLPAFPALCLAVVYFLTKKKFLGYIMLAVQVIATFLILFFTFNGSIKSRNILNDWEVFPLDQSMLQERVQVVMKLWATKEEPKHLNDIFWLNSGRHQDLRKQRNRFQGKGMNNYLLILKVLRLHIFLISPGMIIRHKGKHLIFKQLNIVQAWVFLRLIDDSHINFPMLNLIFYIRAIVMKNLNFHLRKLPFESL